MHKRPITIMMADDDADDRSMTAEALQEAHVLNELITFEDGSSLMECLQGRGSFQEQGPGHLPALILLDLNMPRMDGREVLQALKADPRLRHIPAVVLTTSKVEEDIVRSYELGASSFIRKPVTFGALVETLKSFGRYWLEVVELPAEHVSR
ncbi:MAG TPA: response regulator [Polyangiaceae bacterium]|nr:response regulator [Polyangiaceae bacterium]